MISRQWRGLAKPSRAGDYVDHLRKETFPQLFLIPGFVGASILRRNVDNGVEFLVVTRWTSLQAVRQFTGRETDAAVVPPAVQDMMIEYDKKARHYDIIE